MSPIILITASVAHVIMAVLWILRLVDVAEEIIEKDTQDGLTAVGYVVVSSCVFALGALWPLVVVARVLVRAWKVVGP